MSEQTSPTSPDQPGWRSHDIGGSAIHLATADSRSTLSSQSIHTLVDDCFTPISEKRYTPLDDSFPNDTRLTLVNEEEDDDDEDKETARSPNPHKPSDEEHHLASSTQTYPSALTLTGNLLLEKAAHDPLPIPLSDPAHSATDPDALPAKLGIRAYRFLRWNFFSVYRRLFTVIFITNLAVLVALVARPGGNGLTYTNTLDAAAANLLLAILMRHEHVVNILFRVSSALPPTAPLLLRRWLAKVYSYGGLHSGCGVASVVWYVAFTGLATRHLVVAPHMEPAVVALAYIILLLLITIAVFAHPRLRTGMHDSFEATHRFAGWTAVALFWAQTLLVAHYNTATATPQGSKTMSRALLRSPPFWCLLLITLCIIYPWTRLRLRTPTIEPLSPHAVRLHFTHTTLDYCQGIRLTDAPLLETHAFAGIPNRSGAKGFSVVISNAGDWTRRIIANPPESIYVKGAPVYGVLRVAAVFSPVVVVATGSGIGPCLSLFHGRPDLNVRILWSTPSPLQTYGQGIIDGVLAADPSAVIVDTRAGGEKRRPDMVRLTYKLWKESGAEAVVVISNPKVTRKVVYGMESRGVPAYGPIWDS